MRSTPILCLLLSAAGVSAQTTATVAAETDVGVFVSDGTTALLDAVAKGSPIPAGTPLTLDVSARGLAAGASCALSPTGGPFTVTVNETAQVNSGHGTSFSAGTTATTIPRSVTQGPHSYLLTITGASFQSVDVTMLSTIAGRPRASAAVDIGADGQVEFDQPADGGIHRKRFAFSGTSVKIRITMDGASSPGNDYDMTVIVAPSNPGCLTTSYGTSCPNTVLTGKDTPVSGNHVVDLDIAGGLPNAPVWWIVGLTQTSIQIPSSPCLLLTDPLVILASTADALGNAKATLTFPMSIQGYGLLQAIPFDPVLGVIFSSNGLRVDCF